MANVCTHPLRSSGQEASLNAIRHDKYQLGDMRHTLLLSGVIGITLLAGVPAGAQQAAPAATPTAAPAAPQPPMPYGLPISLALAKKAAAAAETEANKTGFPSGIVIVGPNGETIYTEEMDNSNNSVVMAAEQKARGAALYRRPSQFFQDRMAQAPFVAQLAGASIVGGGIPLVVNGHIVGAIGVGGAPTSQGDIQAAQAGADAVK
jgi:glc operon protein GlcG